MSYSREFNYQDERAERARKLRKESRYAEAREEFKHIWEENPNRYVGWQYAQCLRKLARLGACLSNWARQSYGFSESGS